MKHFVEVTSLAQAEHLILEDEHQGVEVTAYTFCPILTLYYILLFRHFFKTFSVSLFFNKLPVLVLVDLFHKYTYTILS